MKKMIAMFILLCAMAFPAHAEEVLNMITTEFCPYVCLPEKKGGDIGFVLDIFKTVFEKKGYAVRFDVQPWLRALKTFDEKKSFDGLLAATRIHPVNKDIAVFPETEICLYTHKFYAVKDSPLVGKWKYTGLDSLKNIRLGGIMGWSYSSAEITKYVNETPEPFVSAMSGNNLIVRNMNMLLKKRTDMYVENEYIVSYFIYKEIYAGNKDMENIVPVDNVPVDEGVGESYPVFYKDRNGQKYADLFTEGMKELRASGQIDSIMAKYGLKDWRKMSDDR
ncbi:MAG: substrate-binding periplasmic protein [Desulfococcaceae bacterium]